MPAATATCKRGGIGHADVLRGEHDHPPHDELGVLAGVQHQMQPEEGGVRVRSAQALDEGRDDVVVLIAGLVVADDPPLQGFLDVGLFDDACSPRPAARVAATSRAFRVSRASPPVRAASSVRAGGADRQAHRPEPALGIRDGAVDQRLQIRGLQGLQLEQGRS